MDKITIITTDGDIIVWPEAVLDFSINSQWLTVRVSKTQVIFYPAYNLKCVSAEKIEKT